MFKEWMTSTSGRAQSSTDLQGHEHDHQEVSDLCAWLCTNSLTAACCCLMEKWRRKDNSVPGIFCAVRNLFYVLRKHPANAKDLFLATE